MHFNSCNRKRESVFVFISAQNNKLVYMLQIHVSKNWNLS